MNTTRLGCVVLVWLAMLCGAASAAGKVALVIGNSNYQNVGALANPQNDATDLAASLTRIGFDVTLQLDLDYVDMLHALQEFSRIAQDADMAVVYFGGHGIEIDQQNYLIPTDARLESDRQVKLETIALELLTETVSGARNLRMVILDACRNNPFIASMKRSPGSSRSPGRGLNLVEPTGGTLVAYSARAGTVAEDGDGRNSPFMSSLLDHIEEPGLDVSLLFRKVRDAVLKATDNDQEPFTYGSLPGDEVYLVPPETPVADLTGGSDDAVTTSNGPDPAAEAFAWKLVQQNPSVENVRTFMTTYAGGDHFDEAAVLLTKLLAPAPPTDEASRLPPADPPTLAGEALTRAVQRELQLAGCNVGVIDGNWGGRSRDALERYAEAAGIGEPDGPSNDLLAAMQQNVVSDCERLVAHREHIDPRSLTFEGTWRERQTTRNSSGGTSTHTTRYIYKLAIANDGSLVDTYTAGISKPQVSRLKGALGETRTNDVGDVYRWYATETHLVRVRERETYATMAHFSLYHVNGRPYCTLELVTELKPGETEVIARTQVGDVPIRVLDSQRLETTCVVHE